MTGAIIFGLLAALMLTGMPISIALGLTVLTFLFTMTQVPIESVALKLFTGIEKFEIMAIPFFILAGNFLTHGGVARRMVNFATSLVGHWHGGLGLAGVVACALFAAVSGSSPATVVAIGAILLPAMLKAGFPKKFGAGIISTAGSLGMLIPPSIVMVIYAVSTNSSIGRLFIAGVIPGLLLAALLLFLAWITARRNHYPRVKLFPERSGGQATIGGFFGLFYALVFTVVPPLMLGKLFGQFTSNAGFGYFMAGVIWLSLTPFTTRNKWVTRFVYIALIVVGLPVYASILAMDWFPGLSAVQTSMIAVMLTLGWISLIQACGRYTHIAPTFRFELMWESLSVWRAYWNSIWGLLLIIVVIGGIYSGLFTPTEAAAMSAVYAFFVAVFVYKDMGLKDVPKVLLSSANMSAMLLYIITNAVLFSFLLTSENIPHAIADWITGMGLEPWMFLIVVNILLLMAGNFMEPSSVLLITAPILFPVAMKLGIDPIHLGVIMTVNMEIGMLTPPVGLNLYVTSGIAKMGLTEVTKACAPWIVAMLAYLMLITFVPGISLWLPNLLMG